MKLEGWEHRSLTDLAQYINGYAFKPDDWEKEGLPIIRIEQLKNPDSICDYYSGKIPDFNIIDNGDLIFSWSASLFLRFWNDGRAALNQHLFKVEAYENTDKYFLKSFIEFYLPEITKASHGSTMQHITRKELDRFGALVPIDKKEQEKIAEVLSTIDRAIAQTEAIIAKQQRIKTGLMQDLLTKGIDENGNIRSEATHEFKDSAIGRIPAQWDVIKLRDTGTWLSGGTPSKSEETYWGSFMPWVCSKDMKVFDLKNTLEMITQKGVLSGSKVVPKDSVLIVVRGMILAHTFPVGYLTRDMAFNQDIKAIIPNENIYGRYLAYWFSTNSSQLLKLTTTATHGTKRLETNELLEFALCLPSKMEQKKIIYLLDKSQHDIEITKEYLQKLDSQKRGLMQDLLTGKVRVTNLLNERELASL